MGECSFNFEIATVGLAENGVVLGIWNLRKYYKFYKAYKTKITLDNRIGTQSGTFLFCPFPFPKDGPA